MLKQPSLYLLLTAALAASSVATAEESTAEPGNDDLVEVVDGVEIVHSTTAAVTPMRWRSELRDSTPAPQAKRPQNPNFTYRGGQVIENIEVVQVMWGASADLGPEFEAYYRAVLDSEHIDLLSEYNTPTQHIGRGSFLQRVQDNTPPTATTVSGSAIETELSKLIGNGSAPMPNNNRVYMVHFAPGIKISSSGLGTSCTDYCGYHTSFTRSGQRVRYAVIPDHGGSCGAGCGGGTKFHVTGLTVSHEFCEAITDPDPGFAPSWYDNSNGEIGDVCIQPTDYDTIKGFSVQTEWSNLEDKCVASRTQANDFSVAAPTSRAVTAGATGMVNVTSKIIAGSPGTITWSMSNLPAGVTAAFTPPSVAAGGMSQLVFTASASTQGGATTVTVTGTNGAGRVHQDNMQLQIVAPGNDFSVAVAPLSANVNAGATVNFNITTAVTAGTPGAVALTVGGLPSGVTGAFNPASVNPGQGSVLTLTAAGNAASGSKLFTVTGMGGGKTHTANATLVVGGGTPQPDAGVGSPDARPAGTPDARPGTPDADPGAEEPDAEEEPIDPGTNEGGCSVGGHASGGAWFLVLGALGLAVARRRRS